MHEMFESRLGRFGNMVSNLAEKDGRHRPMARSEIRQLNV